MHKPCLEVSKTVRMDSDEASAQTPIERPELSVREAAEAAGVDQATIRRRLRAEEFPSAYQDGEEANAPWRIPVTDLLAAGFKLHKPSPGQGSEQPMGSAQAPGENPQRVLELEEQITDLRERLEEEQRDKEGLRRLVYAHEDHIQTLKRMLPPAPQDRAQEFMQHPAQSVQTPMHASSKDVKAPRRRWFRREQGSGQ